MPADNSCLQRHQIVWMFTVRLLFIDMIVVKSWETYRKYTTFCFAITFIFILVCPDMRWPIEFLRLLKTVTRSRAQILSTKLKKVGLYDFYETEKLKDIIITVIRDYLVVSHIILTIWSSANEVCEKVHLSLLCVHITCVFHHITL